ncbi:PAAR domain-containing protein [Enterobacter hormaechei]
MGQPAARATIDVSAHSGPIQSGSPDVIIGGFPAARKGDTLSCSTHGSGIIVGGSGTVFVNGMPLARQGDKTKCDVSGSPAPAIPKAAAPQYWGGARWRKMPAKMG